MYRNIFFMKTGIDMKKPGHSETFIDCMCLYTGEKRPVVSGRLSCVSGLLFTTAITGGYLLRHDDTLSRCEVWSNAI